MEASLKAGVEKVIALSTDKGLILLIYGATKLCSDKVFIAGNSYSGDTGAIFLWSDMGMWLEVGECGPVFAKQRKRRVLTITHPEMTSFDYFAGGVDFVLKSLESMVAESFCTQNTSM